MTPPLLTHREAAHYWDSRHALHSHLRSGGHIGFSESENAMIYAARLGQLVSLIGVWSSSTHPLDVLDAGCGKGYFAHGLAEVGNRVVAIDQSKAAIGAAPSHPSVTYVVSELATFDWPHAFDVVAAVDVLYHILDDDEWARSVERLGLLARFGGRLILSDTMAHEAENRGVYVRHRPVAAYRDVLEPLGIRYSAPSPYILPKTGLAFQVFHV